MKIGHYEIVRLLGKGGMSEVYEVENPQLGSRHALKLYSYEKNDTDVRERFLVEGRLLAKLHHPRVVRVTDVGTDEASGRPFFVMDLILDEQGAVRQLSDVEPGTVDEETVGRWYDDIREGLAYIHANGVIHRDLKLQNVLIGPDGHAVLTDFGISKVFDPKGDGVQIVDTVNTIIKMREGRSLVMGSLGYLAPELEMGVAASPQSDWYALGVIVYRLLTGTWCDSRTDILGTLETYDPVWKRILPKLLHSNPNGRECPPYGEEKRADREEAEFEAEERWLKEKRRGHVARHVARAVGIAAAVLVVVGAFGVRKFFTDREIAQLRLRTTTQELEAKIQGLQAKLQSGGYAGLVPGFAELFRIPPGATQDDQTDAAGNVTMPSRTSFEAAQVDALVLTYDKLDALRAGKLTPEGAIRAFEALCDGLDESAATSAFDRLTIGGGEYMQTGDTDALRILLKNAIDRLQTLVD